MAPCCNNTVTPRMIKAGNVSVGDRIQLDDLVQASKEASADAKVSAEAPAESSKEYIPVQSPNLQVQDGIIGIPGSIKFEPEQSGSVSGASAQGQQNLNTNNHWYQAPIYGMNAANSQSMQFEPLPYAQMTQYMGGISLGGSVEAPSIVTPQAPMTPNGFDEEIDYDSVQAFNGFLRTQIGRYMRIEQLVGSNTIEDRFGFLVGVGTNFIILQEITTGNIMVIDIFSIRLTYVYYSPPVIPSI